MKPDVNVKMFEKVMAQIDAEPQRLFMGSWFSSAGFDSGFDCGTTACMAGHAVAIAAMEGKGMNKPLRIGPWVTEGQGQPVVVPCLEQT